MPRVFPDMIFRPWPLIFSTRATTSPSKGVFPNRSELRGRSSNYAHCTPYCKVQASEPYSHILSDVSTLNKVPLKIVGHITPLRLILELDTNTGLIQFPFRQILGSEAVGLALLGI
jgi:hypothetical protein